MKKRYRIIAITLVLILLLTGCNIAPAPTDPTNTGTVNTLQSTTGSDPDETRPTFMYDPVEYKADFSVPETGLNAKVQYLPETVENPDNLPVLKWVCIAEALLEGKYTWTEDAVYELNRMLADRDMPYRVQFVMLTGDAWLYTEWFSRPEAQELLKDADLIYAFMTQKNQQEYLMPITEYVTGDAQPTLKNAVVHKLNWTGSMIDGEIYGIQTYPLETYSHGWKMKPETLTKYGLTEKDFELNFWEMDEIFQKIYEKNGNQPFLKENREGYFQDNKTWSGVLPTLPMALDSAIRFTAQSFGLTFGIDISSGSPKVVNMLEMDSTRRIQEAIIRYKDAGYFTEEDAQIYYDYCEGAESYIHRGLLHIPITSVVFENYSNSYKVSGVAQVSKYKDEAVSLLNLIAEDEEFRHQLLYGKEGRDYTVTDGNYAAITNEDGAYYNMEFLSPYSKFDSVKENDIWTIRYDGKTKLETYLDCMNSVTFCYYPITFDFSGLETEMEEYARIYGDYCRYLTNHIVDMDDDGNPLPYMLLLRKIDDVTYEKKILRMDAEAYGEMLQKLNDAGAQKIIAELQRQLDEWLANNPDWLEKLD